MLKDGQSMTRGVLSFLLIINYLKDTGELNKVGLDGTCNKQFIAPASSEESEWRHLNSGFPVLLYSRI